MPDVRTKKEVTVDVGYLGRSYDLDVDAMTPWVLKPGGKKSVVAQPYRAHALRSNMIHRAGTIDTLVHAGSSPLPPPALLRRGVKMWLAGGEGSRFCPIE